MDVTQYPEKHNLVVKAIDMDFRAAAAWIYAGGPHHTGFSRSLTTEHVQDFADMADIELLCIDKGTQLRPFRNELRWNAAAYR